jgi:hypothetical protein
VERRKSRGARKVDRAKAVEIDAKAENRAVAALKQGRIGNHSGDGEKSLKRPILKGAKYRNQPTVVEGHRFDSKKEARRYQELRYLEQKGVIENLSLQVAFVLAPSVRFEDEPRAKPALKYVADFVYSEGGRRIVEDVKSGATAKAAAYRIKRHLMKAVHGIEVKEV